MNVPPILTPESSLSPPGAPINKITSSMGCGRPMKSSTLRAASIRWGITSLLLAKPNLTMTKVTWPANGMRFDSFWMKLAFRRLRKFSGDRRTWEGRIVATMASSSSIPSTNQVWLVRESRSSPLSSSRVRIRPTSWLSMESAMKGMPATRAPNVISLAKSVANSLMSWFW